MKQSTIRPKHYPCRGNSSMAQTQRVQLSTLSFVVWALSSQHFAFALRSLSALGFQFQLSAPRELSSQFPALGSQRSLGSQLSAFSSSS